MHIDRIIGASGVGVCMAVVPFPIAHPRPRETDSDQIICINPFPTFQPLFMFYSIQSDKR